VTHVLGTYHPRRRPPRRVRVLARTSGGNYVIEYLNQNLHLNRTIVLAKNLTLDGGN
jgi:hypothetical protein